MSGLAWRPLAFGDADIADRVRSLIWGCPAFVPGFSLFGHSQKLLLLKPTTLTACKRSSLQVRRSIDIVCPMGS